jgi:hypothetical protein
MARNLVNRLETSSGAAQPRFPPTPGSRKSLPDRRDWQSRDRLLRRVRAEFVDMPGLQLTFAQAQRLFHLQEDVCLRVLRALEVEGLIWRHDGLHYANRSVTALL